MYLFNDVFWRSVIVLMNKGRLVGATLLKTFVFYLKLHRTIKEIINKRKYKNSDRPTRQLLNYKKSHQTLKSPICLHLT